MSAEQTLLAGIGSALTIAGSITKAVNGPRVFLAKLGWDLLRESMTSVWPAWIWIA